MELRHLRYFLAVADAGSFTSAAERLGVVQPALSQQIRALEGELGVTLIDRGARMRGLTEAGARFATRARGILLEAAGAVEEMAAVAGARIGRVRLGCALQSLTEARVAGILGEFRRRHPGLNVTFREAYTRPLLERLAHGRLDLALVHLGKGEGPPGLKVEYQGLPVEIERLYEEPLLLVVGPRHRLADRHEVRWKDLTDEELIGFGPGSTIRELVARAAREARIEIRTSRSAANLGSIRALVSAGLGVAVLPKVALTLSGPALRGIRLVAPRLTRIVALARNTTRYESPAARTLAEFLRARLRP